MSGCMGSEGGCRVGTLGFSGVRLIGVLGC